MLYVAEEREEKRNAFAVRESKGRRHPGKSLLGCARGTNGATKEARYVVLPSSTSVRERLPAHCPPKAQKVLCTSKVAVHPPKRTYYTLGTPPALAQN